jgi:glucose-6-phosphate dehydrogenase assembly protein OpcA
MPQVCSERIVLRAGPNALDLLPGAVRPLLEAELPMVLWWTSDPRPHAALFRDLADECSRLILDLPDPSAAPEAIRLGLDPAVCRYSRDSAWFGLTRWRELVAQFFDPSCQPPETLSRIEAVRIAALSPDPTRPPRLALWLAAWLAGQLGWKPQGQPARKAGTAESTYHATLAGPAGNVTVEIGTQPAPSGLSPSARLMGVTITAGGDGPAGAATFRLDRPAAESAAIRIESETRDACRLPRLVEAPELDPAHRIGAALESSRLDPPFQNALPILLWLLEHAG